MALLLRKLSLIIFIFIHGCLSIPVGKTQAEIRASLITKDTFRDHLNRNKKQLQSPAVPAPFIVSTELKIADQGDKRRGRSYPDGKGNTIVEGVRLPDDSSDRMTYRNGRFINNVFVPNDTPVPSEVVVSTVEEKSPRIGKMINYDPTETSRSFNPDFNEYYLGGGKPATRDSLAMESRKIDHVVPAPKSERPDSNSNSVRFQQSKPVYFTSEEPDSLHADRSPYNYEPADAKDTPANPEVEFFHSGIAPAKQSDFVVKEHIYTMCPGCPTFSIPIPIPVASLRQDELLKQQIANNQRDDHVKQEKNIFEIMGDKILSNVKGLQGKVFDPILNRGKDESNVLKEKKGDAQEEGSGKGYLPMMVAGAAAVALGSIAILGSGSHVKTIGARQNPSDVMKNIFLALEKYDEKQ